MLFNTRTFILVTLLSSSAIALPFELAPRAKSYEVINVDGGSSTQAPPAVTTTVKATTTIEVLNSGPTVTQEIIATVVQPAPHSVSASSSSTNRPLESSSIPTPTSVSTSASTPAVSSPASTSTTAPAETPKPIFVTITVPGKDQTTEYYDDGMWHTRYAIKSFEPVVVPSATPSS